MYKKIYLVYRMFFFIIAYLFPVSVLAQTTFERIYGGLGADIGYYVQQTSDGGYIIAGEIFSFGADLRYVYLIKTDTNGYTMWTRTYGGTSPDYGYSVQQTSDEGYIITGSTMSFGAGETDVYLIKTDANGDSLWTRTYGGTLHDGGNSVQQTSEGGYIIAGMTRSFGAGEADVYLINTGANGDTLWTRTYGGAVDDKGNSVQQTSDGGYIIAGETYSFGAGETDVYLIKTDANGDTLWTRTYGGGRWDDGHSVQQTLDGGYIIVGGTDSFSASMVDDVYLIKTNVNGDTLWTRTYGGTVWDAGYSVLQTSDGGYVIAGGTGSFSADDGDVYLIKTDTNGDTLWTRTHGGTEFDRGRTVQQTSDGGYIIAGETKSFGIGEYDVYLIKTNSVGLTGIKKEYMNTSPESYNLVQNYPNPFNLSTTISFSIPKGTDVLLKIYDLSGREIDTLMEEYHQPGEYRVQWNAKGLPSGIYLYRLEAGEYVETRKMLLVE